MARRLPGWLTLCADIEPRSLKTIRQNFPNRRNRKSPHDQRLIALLIAHAQAQQPDRNAHRKTPKQLVQLIRYGKSANAYTQ